MAKRFGKNINMHKLSNKRPSNNKISPRQLKYISTTNNTTVKNNKNYFIHKNQVPRGEGETTTDFKNFSSRAPGLNNPFYSWALDNKICVIKDKIKPGTLTDIDIANPTGHLGQDLLRKGDTFWIYNKRNYYSKKLTCDNDLKDADTKITITSTAFTIHDQLPAGSLVIPDYKAQTQRLTNVPLFKTFELTQTQYQNLASNPLVLLPAQTGILHIPLSATLIYKHNADEMTRADLFIGHNRSTTVGKFWSKYRYAFYRSRDSMLIQMTVGTYNDTSYPGVPVISSTNTGVGLALEMYTNTNFSGTSNLTVYLYYKSIDA